MQVRSASSSAKPDQRQLSIFDLEAVEKDQLSNAAPLKEKHAKQGASKPAKASTHEYNAIPLPGSRVIAIADLPDYPPELIEQVDRSVADLPPEKLWFTYRDIQRCFGVSRATIARRMHAGIIPGIRMHDGRVLCDGAVRRFDRMQLRWLLLSIKRQGEAADTAVGTRHKQKGEPAI